MKSGFKLIGLEAYVDLHLRSNPGVKRDELVRSLKSALAADARGECCACGEPIWILGSAIAGRACFTCITGEAEPDHDYEVVAGRGAVRRSRQKSRR